MSLSCKETGLRGSVYCSYCGQPLTLEAATKKELSQKIRSHANASFWFGVLGLIPPLLFLLVAALPFIALAGPTNLAIILTIFTKVFTSASATLSQGGAAATIPVILFVALPCFLLGQKAVSEGQKAIQFLNLSFNVEKIGKKRALLGQAWGWFDIYLGIGIVAIVTMFALFITSQNLNADDADSTDFS